VSVKNIMLLNIKPKKIFGKGDVMKYKVSGVVNLKGDKRKFSMDLEAESEAHLRDKVLAYLGSKYGVRRSSVEISEIKKGA